MSYRASSPGDGTLIRSHPVARSQKGSQKGQPPQSRRISIARLGDLTPDEKRWILFRCGTFGADGLPALSYRDVSRNLRRSRRVYLHESSIRRLVAREDPELARRRLEAARSRPFRRPAEDR